MQNADLGGVPERLVNDAVSFSQTKQRGELFFARIGIQIELQSNLLEADWHVFGNAEGAAEIEIALRSKRRVAQRNVQSGSDCAQRDARAAYERFEQHIGRTRALSIPARRWVKPGFDARFSRFDFAGDSFSDSPLRVERDRRGLRMLAILRF
jgi:hypothetical protein